MEEANTIRHRGRRRRVAVVLAACVLVGLGVVPFWPGEREPEYNGKKLSEWLWIIGTNSTTDRQIINDTTNLASITYELSHVIEAVRAVRAIGTNALPFLIRWTLDAPKWRRNLTQAYCSKCPKFLYSDAVGNWIYGEDPNKFAVAIVGFQITVQSLNG